MREGGNDGCLSAPASGQLPVEGSVEMLFDFDTRGECPVCHERCGLMFKASPGHVNVGFEVIKPHTADDDD